MKLKKNTEFSQALITWYKLNKRDLPWRETSAPYAIWLSEIILQQTRVAQGIDYYYRLLEAFPDIHTLAAASEDQVMKLWQGLGYYSRACNMHATAKYISAEQNGVFPGTYTELLKLKGIGEYTAAAIASIAFGEAVPVVDGNVLRFFTRYTGLNKPVEEAAVKKNIRKELQGLMDRKQPALFNQAMMEIGALCCKPKNPQCGQCPLQKGCYAFMHNQQQILPVKKRKKEAQERYFHYLVMILLDKTFISRREGKDIWNSLYEFPLIETAIDTPEKELFATPEFAALLPSSRFNVTARASYRHVLTHQVIHARFYILQLSGSAVKMTGRTICIPLDELESYAFPRLISRFLASFRLE